jgi:tripartite-type tricarboxylate transporter receptor subunit TctC
MTAGTGIKTLLCGLICAVAGAAAAQPGYPSKPLRMIVPFAPGGASDFVARIIQPRLNEQLKQQVVIDNRAGAAGNIGVDTAARATPDGHTFLLGNIGTMAINPNVYTKFPIKPLRDLVPVIQIVDVPGALVVHPSIPAKSVKEFISYLKANPNKLNFGSPGGGSANRIEMEMFKLLTKTEMVHVPYKGGAGPAMTGLLGNEVQTMFVTFSSAVNFAKQGRVRMLGVVSPERVPALPDVHTMPEQGFKDMTIGSWQGIFVPKSTPRSVVNKLFEATTQTMRHPEVIKRLSDGGVSVIVSKSPEAFAAFHKSENERFAKAIREAKIETE